MLFTTVCAADCKAAGMEFFMKTKKSRRLLVFLVTAAMLIGGVLPTTALADTAADQGSSIEKSDAAGAASDSKEAGSKDAENQASYLESISFGFSASALNTFDLSTGAASFDIECVASKSGSGIVKAVLSSNAPEGSKITAVYTNSSGKKQNIAVNSGTNTTLYSVVKKGMTGNSIDIVVGVSGNEQTYSVNINRVPAVGITEITDADGNALALYDGCYLLPEASETFKLTANSYGAELTVNSQAAESGTAVTMEPVWTADETFAVTVKASSGEKYAEKTISIKKFKSTDVITGSCGTSATFKIANDELTISGTGAMTNFTSGSTPWNAFLSKIKKVTVEDGITAIGNNSFANAVNLSDVSLPSSLTSVGTYAFSSCGKLTSIDIPDSTADIGMYAFNGCTGLTEITFSGSIGAMAFNNCSALKTATAEEGVKTIGTMAFNNCSSLETLNLPKSLEKFDTTAFNGCSAVKKITVKDGGIYSVQNGLLCEGTKIIYAVPSTSGALVIPEGITEIGASVFAQNKNITSVTFPSTLKTIGNAAFSGSGISGVLNLSKNITSYGAQCFQACSGITEVNFETNTEETVTYGNSMLGTCLGLTKVNIPDNITALNGMLYNCRKLSSLDMKNVQTVSSSDLYNMASLKELKLGKSLTKFNTPFNDNCHPSVIYYEGSEEDWNKIEFYNTTLDTIEKYDIAVVFNYDGTSSGKAPVIKNTLAEQNVSQYMRAKALTLDVESEEGAELKYFWYCGDEIVGEGSSYAPSTEQIGTNEYYAKVLSIKDGKVGITYSNKVKVTVNNPSTDEPFEGKGTEDNPYLIKNEDDLNTLSAMVQYKDSYEGKYFKMTADITLPAGWIPVGCTKDGTNNIKNGENLMAFSGIFDGDNHTITVPKGGLPLFGYVKEAEIKNLNIYGEQIDGYGLVNNYEGVGLSGNAVIIDNVTLKSGTKTLKAGFIGGNITTNGYAANSAKFLVTIRNCTVEENVTVGYSGNQNMIGSFAGRFQGTIENCVSYATVKGNNYVGGIMGSLDNSMGQCKILNCSFFGEVQASGDNAGGIVGGGYSHSSAPNGFRITVKDCLSSGKITGKNNVGGIFGGDVYVAQDWENNNYEFSGNHFSGTVSGESNVGGIIGFYESLNKYDNISDNTYTLDCGAKSGFGAVKYVDTNYENPTAVDGTVYFSTENGTSDCPTVQWCMWKAAYNRTDDPLGADAEKLAKGVESDKMIAAKVDEMIDAIDMTASDKAEQVAEARAAYDALTEAQQKLVNNISKLNEYEQQLTDEEKAEEVEKLIEALPAASDITVNDGDAVKAARAAYDSLTDNQKKFVSDESVSKLEAAEAAYEKAVKESQKGTGDDTKGSTQNSADSSAYQTGDDADMALWIALMLLAGSAAAGTTVAARKRRYNR